MASRFPTQLFGPVCVYHVSFGKKEGVEKEEKTEKKKEEEKARSTSRRDVPSI